MVQKYQMTGLTQVSTHLMCHYYANHVESMNLFSSVRGENEDLFLRSIILCVSVCLTVCGIVAFRAFKAWKREFGTLTRQQSERPKNILWKSQKEPVENDDNTWYDTVSLITNVIVLSQKLIIG